MNTFPWGAVSRLRMLGVGAVAGLSMIAVGACSDGGDEPMAGHDMSSHASPTSGASSSTSFNAADVMFAQMMIPHHQQAVEMSDLILNKNGIDPEVKSLAEQIKKAQQPEIDTMEAWLKEWGGQMSDHSGMDHGSDSGMMTPEDISELKAAAAPEAQLIFLSGMIAHHQGAIAMAKDLMAEGMNPDAQAMASAIISSQQAEIATMEKLLQRL